MKAHDLRALRQTLARRAMKGTPTFAGTPFARLAPFNHGGVFVGRFRGQTPWERHPHGDELVHVLDGEVELTLLRPRGPRTVTLRAGGVFVVPRGRWHRQRARSAVTLLTATPTPTDHSFADDPRCPRRRKRPG